MLSLTRKEGQSLRIGDDVIITIERVEDKVVELSVQAPSSIKVIRAEVVDFMLICTEI
ncbi:MAG: carbon storage regulator [Gammaproteobacteria bacterium]|nr:carbon storage regulator [Gammaproteobacteria bacterium]MBU1832245.1 carbon storage regulator [Gammaproteobacteria bacterium]